MPKLSKPTIYIETTIPNFYFDLRNQSIENKIDTAYFWNNNLQNFKPICSLAVIRELSATSNRKWQKILLQFIQNIKIVEINKAVINLAEKYVINKLIPHKYSADAIHLALSTIHKIDYLLTWNIQHLAHPSKRKLFRDYNIAQELFVTEIVTPRELNFQINQD